MDDIQAACSDLLQTCELLQALLPNESIRRKLDNQAKSAVQDWGEVFEREKTRLLRKQFEEWRAGLEAELSRLVQDLGDVVKDLNEHGFCLALYQRYKVR